MNNSGIRRQEESLEFLTPEWGAAIEEAANASDAFREAARGVELTIRQEVDGLRYALRFGDGRLRVEWGDVDGADVTFAQTRDTAERISRGELNAQQAFVLGKLRVRGDLERLLPARDAFARLEGAFAEVRGRTTY